MMKHGKEKNIVIDLSHRERHTKPTPFRLHKVFRNLILSKDKGFRRVWEEKSVKPIFYEGGHIYFNNYSTCTTIYGVGCEPSFNYCFAETTSNRKIIDAISFTSPVFKTIKQITSNPPEYLPLSKYLLFITKDDFLCQYNSDNGSLMKEIYVKPYGVAGRHKTFFQDIAWDIYSEQFVLCSGLNPTQTNDDVVAIIAVFTTYPIEFYALFEIKRSVFGKKCQHVNISDRQMILGMGQHNILIYSFKDVLEKGSLQPYRIGENCSIGKVGVFSTGLPINLTIDSTPPLLFNVSCHDRIVLFGGFPFHYIYLKTVSEDAFYTVKSVRENKVPKNGSFKSNILLCEEDYAVDFHPDGSNRILHTTANSVHCYKMFNNADSSELEKIYTMGFPTLPPKTSSYVSSYGRRCFAKTNFDSSDRNILAIDYEDELELFGILGTCPQNPDCVGFVILYDNLSGEEVKRIKLDRVIHDDNHYSLQLDLDSIIIIEQTCSRNFNILIYRLCDDCLISPFQK